MDAVSNYSRSNIFREPLPNECGKKNKPEELHPFLLKEDTLATMHGIKQLNGRDQVGIYCPGGVN
jgi:hypothetical protein